jgi:hypothetical protein
MNAADIAAALGDAFRVGRFWRCRCPVHGGRSLTLRDGDGGRLLVTCWGGCDRLDVLAELHRLHLLNGSATYRPRSVRVWRDGHDDAGADDARRIARARYTWDEASDARGGPVARYLLGRGIELHTWPASLRYHPRCPRPDGTRVSAMVALVERVGQGIGSQPSDTCGGCRRRCDRASLGPIGGGGCESRDFAQARASSIPARRTARHAAHRRVVRDRRGHAHV